MLSTCLCCIIDTSRRRLHGRHLAALHDRHLVASLWAARPQGQLSDRGGDGPKAGSSAARSTPRGVTVGGPAP